MTDFTRKDAASKIAAAIATSTAHAPVDPPRNLLREFLRSDAVIFPSLALFALVALAIYLVILAGVTVGLMRIAASIPGSTMPCLLVGLVFLGVTAAGFYRAHMRLYDRALEISQETDMIQFHRRETARAARTARRTR